MKVPAAAFHYISPVANPLNISMGWFSGVESAPIYLMLIRLKDRCFGRSLKSSLQHLFGKGDRTESLSLMYLLTNCTHGHPTAQDTAVSVSCASFRWKKRTMKLAAGNGTGDSDGI